jgi:hypothetical protein
MTKPAAFAILARWLAPFEPLFTRPTWQNLLVLLAGTILAPGRRTVSSALSILALREATGFTNFHRVLNRNRWPTCAAAKHLLHLLLRTFAPSGPVIVGIDETIERRWGPKIKVPWHLPRSGPFQPRPLRQGQRPALDFRHAARADPLGWSGVGLAVPDRAGTFGAVRARAGPPPQEADRLGAPASCPGGSLAAERRLIAVADSSYAAIELLMAVCRRLTVITRLRLDARLFDPPPPRRPGTWGRPRMSGARQPTLAERLADPTTRWRRVTVAGWYGRTERQVDLISGTALWYHPGKRVPVRWLLVRDVAGAFEAQGFLCTDPDADPLDMLRWFVRRWSVEVTFAEVRRHLGVETQRQWSDLAIARTTPALLALFSLVTLWAEDLLDGGILPRRAAWYPKPRPSFSDALAAVRYRLWTSTTFATSQSHGDVAEIPRATLEQLVQAACYPA